MKKTMSILLAAVLLLSTLTGCGGVQQSQQESEKLDIVPTIFQEITGIPQNETVVTVGSTEVPAELYFYWVCYVCSSLEYNILSDYSNYGMYGSCVNRETMTVDWTGQYAGIPLMEYALAQAEDTMKYYMSIEELAADLDAGLTTNNLVDMEASFQTAVQEMGGEEAFLSYLQMLGISRETFDRLSASSFLYINLLDLVFREDSELYLTDEDYNKHATYADHILIATQDMKTGESLLPTQTVEKYQLADDLLQQILAAEDPEAKFKELADEYSDDPGRESNPNGYIYTAGTMVEEFEMAASQLQPGEFSEVVQSDYGFHIILRRDLTKALQEDETQKVEIAKQYLNKFLVQKRSASEVEYDPRLQEIDWVQFYADYIANVDAITAQMQAAQ